MTINEYMKKLDTCTTDPACKAQILDTVEVWENNAAAGYTVAAASAAGLDQRQTARLLDALGAAFENMTVQEAIDLYQSSDF